MSHLSRISARALTTALVATLVLAGGMQIRLGASAAADQDASSHPVRDAAERFVGSWQLVSFEARTGSGDVVYPFGQDADGVLTYTRDGRMSATVWRHNRRPFAINDQQKGTPEEYAAAVQSYLDYIGTFDVDHPTGTVSHHIEQSIFPNWNGTTQTRFYEFTDHRHQLTLTTPPTAFGGTTLVSVVIWQRI